MKRSLPEELADNSNKKPRLSLDSLLDVTSLSTHEELAQRFTTIAHELCNCTHLRLHTGSGSYLDYSIAEVEFYLMKDGHHDPFCHGADAQKVLGHWYFHRAPTRAGGPSAGTSSTTSAAGGYRGGTRKGLDLTFGGPVGSGAVGGILLRSIRRTSDDKLISGPSLLVDELLKQSSVTSVAALVASWDNLAAFRNPDSTSSTSLSRYMELVSRSDAQLPVHKSPRIGLDLSHKSTVASVTDERVTFVALPYRFFVRPDTLTANGRMQTYVGLYEAFATDPSLKDNPQRVLAKVCGAMGLKTKSGEEYAASYRTGLKSANVKKFVGVKTSSPKAYLEMVGALRTYLARPAPE
ncbi:hypothetical protein EXIGLDRAFT_770075 [Exidia glandulosa HHB12029]|uniref:Uncharacterized protein n=1 Tax=Exidia glandulosa HHB12029 TaxID=1314781 RepID=A0A165H0R0_EXIGL|nr:hypothetical protein EXIGLDRAFT_770075 [Exidia glandulosa HHB12029]